MSECIVEIVNSIKGVESYLELGTGDGVNFSKIACANKVSIDVNGNGTVTSTTDEYFAGLSESVFFDIIFIDANHNLDNVVRDYNNAMEHATGMIILHDMIPPAEMYTKSIYCSDSYKLLHHFMRLGNQFYALNDDMGLTVIKEFEAVRREDVMPIGYEQFMTAISRVKLYSVPELIGICNKDRV